MKLVFVNTHINMTESIFEENSYAQNGVNETFLGPNVYLIKGINEWVKVTVLEFRENLYYFQSLKYKYFINSGH